MKTLYLIGGTMGVGKTTTCQMLKKALNQSVFLDGDWCWDAHPFVVSTETKKMVQDNIVHLLNNFIHCSEYQHIIFCWVMHQQSIIDDLLSQLDVDDLAVVKISLICRQDALIQRLSNDIEQGKRKQDVISRSVERLPLYLDLDTVKIDVSDISSQEAAAQIMRYALEKVKTDENNSRENQ